MYENLSCCPMFAFSTFLGKYMIDRKVKITD